MRKHHNGRDQKQQLNSNPPSPKSEEVIYKKQWERGFKSFLKGRGHDRNSRSTEHAHPPPPPLGISRARSGNSSDQSSPSFSFRRTRSGTADSFGSNGNKSDIGLPLDNLNSPTTSPRKNFVSRLRKSSSNYIPAETTILIPPQNQLDQHQQQTFPLQPRLEDNSSSEDLIKEDSHSSASHTDTAVHGGSIFASFKFKRNRSSASLNTNRSSSNNSLDTTVRKGYETAYSPTNQRFLKTATTAGSDFSHPPTVTRVVSKENNYMGGVPIVISNSDDNDNAVSDDEDGGNQNQELPPILMAAASITSNSDELSIRGGIPQGHISTTEPNKSHHNALIASRIASKDKAKEKEEIHSNGTSNDTNSNKELIDDSLTSSQSSMKEMKVAFTEFHNAPEYGQDSTSPFLGDEPSHYAGNHFLTAKFSSRARQYNNQMLPTIMNSSQSSANLAFLSMSERNIPRNRSADFISSSPPLSTVMEDVSNRKGKERILKEFLGLDTWEEGRRYLIAPAAFWTCPRTSIRTVFHNRPKRSIQDYPDMTVYPFGTIELGEAIVTYVGNRRQGEPYGWVSCFFELRDNYLLEYSVEDNRFDHDLPRGYAHIQHATCTAHTDFPDTLQFEFFGSPCAFNDKRTLMLRVKSTEERDRWVRCLSAAANLSISDLYEYDDNAIIGQGRYAKVHPAKRKTESSPAPSSQRSQNDCALKIINKNEFWKRVNEKKERSDTLAREMAVHATISAKCFDLPTFLQLRGFFETCDNMVLELELMEGGKDLFQHVQKHQSLSEDAAAHIMRDILTSLDAMQRNGIGHRDVKPANILMCNDDSNSNNNQNISVKIADFGMSTFVDNDGLLVGRCGTPGYVAPEILRAGCHTRYKNKVDVFSAGVTLHVMLMGYEPFYGDTDAELTEANKQGYIDYTEDDWVNISNECRDLLSQMLQVDPNRRIEARAALLHPWIVNRAPPRVRMAGGLSACLKAQDEMLESSSCAIS